MRNIKNEKGQALVEFAIILPILLLLIMGILQFGLLINSYLALENSSREGARLGIVGCTDKDIQNIVMKTAPTLNSNALTINITPSEGSRKSGDTLTINLTYNYNLTIPIISTLFNNSVTLNAQTSMRIEWEEK